MAADSAGPVDTAAAEAFEAHLVPTIFGPWSRALVDLAAPLPGERVIDVACGTGAAARHAAALVAPGGAVAALDIDAGMVAHAETLDRAGAIAWRRGDALALPYAAESFDVALCNQGLQFFADRARGLAEMRRVLAADGRMALAVYCAIRYCPAHEAVARALEAQGGDPGVLLRPYAFGDALALGDEIAAAGFRDVAVLRRQMEARFASVRAFVEGLAAGGPPARRALDGLDAAALDGVVAAAAAALAPYIDSAGLCVVTTANMALARR